jgi:capsular exopolysaccharide synthesis family protein
MEPVDYLKVLKNHWKVVVALVILAAVAVFFTSPKEPSKAYAAEHKLLLEQGIGGTSSMANIGTVAELALNPVVAERAAAALGYDGEPSDLAAKVDATADPELLIITITGTAGTQDEAIAIANAFGEEVKKYVDEREAERLETEAAEAQTQQDTVEAELVQVQAELANDPNNLQLLGRQSALTQQLGNLVTLEDFRANTARYTTVLGAAFASEDAAFVAGFGREQRALIAAVVAALAGFGVAIMLDRSDSRLRTKDQVERRFGLPVLAEVPLLALRDRSRAAVVAFEREPRVAEAYRGLRTALLLFRGRSGSEPPLPSSGNGHGHIALAQPAASVRQLVVVTSPEAGDGKSTTAANLAMAYAEAGQSVLLVSWDLWRPLSPGVFDAQDGPGVADYLDGNATSLVRYVQDTSIPGVRIVTAGLGGHHPYTQIETTRRLLEEGRTLANIVIVDTAPILSASVTRELVTLADAVVVVCRSGRTTAPVADRCAELLERLGAPALGVVLVGVPTGPFADYYGAPPKESRGVGRAGFGRRSEETSPRHKAPTSAASSVRPTSAQYRATTPRGTEGREMR